jgi:capsular exopolysaccharide synthesis family protein
MSEFFRALGQADRDRALREQAREKESAPPVDEPQPATVEVIAAAPPPRAEAPVRVETPVRAEVAASAASEASAAASVFRRAPRTRRRQVPPSDAADHSMEGLDAHLVSLVTPATFEAEQYRALRHMIEELQRSSGLTVVAVSSPSVGDGKTTTAINLAGALAQSRDTRVLLIDADLRRPSVREKFGLQMSPSPGLVGGLLDRSVTLGAAVRRRPPFNLDILPAGDSPTAPYELLRSPRLGELMKEARAYYSYVIVDTPPLVGVPDCRALANFVDGFLVVVAAHRTPKRLVEDALNIVEPGKVIGLLYNRDDRPLSGYYTQAYGRYTNGNGHRKWPWTRR